jgi:hypothetical protein
MRTRHRLISTQPATLEILRNADLDLNRPRTIGEIFRTAVQVFVRSPLLFLFLAGIVVVPYEVVVLLLSHGKGSLSTGTEFVVLLVALALVNPTVAALEVQAVLSLAEGQRPQLADVFRRALVVLPVVAAAEIIASLGTAAGFICFFVPGLILALRWAVVAQVAAVEHTNWPTAIRRSGELARGNYLRIFAVLLMVAVANLIVSLVIGKNSGSAVLGIALAIVAQSFSTLLTSFLYFDLRAREATSIA